MSSVFLSHNSNDKPWVRSLAKRLTEDGVVVWLDEAELKIGDSLIDRISEGIENMEFIAAVISENSISSSWVQKELSLAMSKEIKGERVAVLPLVIGKCDLPASLADKLYADFTDSDNYDNEYRKLLRAIGVTKPEAVEKVRQPQARSIRSVAQQPAAELKSVGIDKEKTQQDREFSGLQHYYFQLSRTPPRGWAEHFTKARQFPRHSMWREAWVTGEYVVVKCALEEIERYHLRDLKVDVATANATLAQAQAAAKARRQYEMEQANKAQQERNAVLDKLKF